MKDGNWIPIDKRLSKYFPNRKFSEIEAAFSLTLDYDNDNPASIAGYSKLWGWSRSKVRLFLDKMGVEILYSEDPSKKQNQKGQIKGQIRDRSETDKLHARMVDSKGSQRSKDRSETDEGQISDRSSDTTSKPIKPKPDPKPKKDKKTIISKPENVSDQTWKDFLTHRKSKKATVTQTAIKTFAKDAELEGMSLEDVFKEAKLL